MVTGSFILEWIAVLLLLGAFTLRKFVYLKAITTNIRNIFLTDYERNTEKY